MRDVVKLGRQLKRLLASEKAYRWLDSSVETRGTSWQSGACWPLAVALHHLLPESKLVAIEAFGVQHHVLVELNGWYLDADGTSSRTELLRHWVNIEGLRKPRIVSFQGSEGEGLVCPPSLVSKLIRHLRPLTRMPRTT